MSDRLNQPLHVPGPPPISRKDFNALSHDERRRHALAGGKVFNFLAEGGIIRAPAGLSGRDLQQLQADAAAQGAKIVSAGEGAPPAPGYDAQGWPKRKSAYDVWHEAYFGTPREFPLPGDAE